MALVNSQQWFSRLLFLLLTQFWRIFGGGDSAIFFYLLFSLEHRIIIEYWHPLVIIEVIGSNLGLTPVPTAAMPGARNKWLEKGKWLGQYIGAIVLKYRIPLQADSLDDSLKIIEESHPC